ncbi:hypothetical protein JW859_08255 [bacterium]|nr:hypothetical protein [bacterium]
MGISAIIKFGHRQAQRNYLYLFAWLCATVVPVGLQLISGQIDEIRDYLAYYFGALSLYMFFAMTYGFGAVFVSYYLVGGFRKAGTLDLLRVSGASPVEVVGGVILALQRVLVPPLIAFSAGFIVYLQFFQRESFISDQPWYALAGMGVVILLTELILSSLPVLGLFRQEAALALIASILVLPFNALPIVILYALGLPLWAFLLLMTGLAGLIIGGAVLLTARLWPPQQKA